MMTIGTRQTIRKSGVVVREIDQKAAIMIVIEHCGDIKPGTRCSAVFFDTERIRREQEFHAKLYSQNGVSDSEIRRAMVAANVPDEPYWLVSLKPGSGTTGEAARLHRVDARTGKVLPEPG
jgi:N-acyl-D-aspartate/D-glutamate deacylase